MTEVATNIWKKLEQHWEVVKGQPMRELFKADPQRFKRYSLYVADLFLDYSKNRITPQTMQMLTELANTCNLPDRIKQMFAGEIVNVTERRAAWHVALRRPDPIPEVKEVFDKMETICKSVRSGEYKGSDRHPIKDVIHIGIGGSDLGPMLIYDSLLAYKRKGPRCHFMSSPDPAQVRRTLSYLNPMETLVVIVSKSFTTAETLHNAKVILQWLEKTNAQGIVNRQVLAVTAKPDLAESFGINPANIFPFWDWVGGRFSLWSAVSLSVAFAIGMDNFKELLAGAHAMDEHFRTAPFEKNMPAILGLLGVWYNNFIGTGTQAIIPYNQFLTLLPSYLQQSHMESLGKRVRVNGQPVVCDTGYVLWGGAGTDSQHSFHQLLMQGTQCVPVDFILPIHDSQYAELRNDELIANCLAQSRTLMQGYWPDEIQREDKNILPGLVPHKIIPGNNPSNTILMNRVSPHSLGALIALYEHKIFVQSIIWGINAFDQWGVERGKKLAKTILNDLHSDSISGGYDSSTKGLLELAMS